MGIRTILRHFVMRDRFSQSVEALLVGPERDPAPNFYCR